MNGIGFLPWCDLNSGQVPLLYSSNCQCAIAVFFNKFPLALSKEQWVSFRKQYEFLAMQVCIQIQTVQSPHRLLKLRIGFANQEIQDIVP